MRGATLNALIGQITGDISIHAPRAGSDHGRWICISKGYGISIHAPRAGSDREVDYQPGSRRISIHAPRAGSDQLSATSGAGGQNFNPRSPCGERPVFAEVAQKFRHFNPRSPCGERLALTFILTSCPPVFQSTLPVRGATIIKAGTTPFEYISIHAPRAGSDWGLLY